MDLFNGLVFGRTTTGDDRRSIVFNPQQEHGFDQLLERLKQVSPNLRTKVIDSLRKEGLWGRVVSNELIMDAVVKNCGYAVGRLIKEKMLINEPMQRLTPEQIKRNIAYARYALRRDAAGSLGLSKEQHQTPGWQARQNQSAGAFDTGGKPETSMSKRPLAL